MDPRTFPRIRTEDYRAVIEALVTITTSTQNTSEYGRELKRAKNQATTRSVSGRRTNSAPISSHDEDATADLDENESNTTVLSRIVCDQIYPDNETVS